MPRQGLSRDAVIAAAMKLADKKGFGELTLGNLARRLGIKTPCAALATSIVTLPRNARVYMARCNQQWLAAASRYMLCDRCVRYCTDLSRSRASVGLAYQKISRQVLVFRSRFSSKDCRVDISEAERRQRFDMHESQNDPAAMLMVPEKIAVEVRQNSCLFRCFSVG